MLNILGSVGFGIVWGWLMVLIGGRGQPPWWNVLPLVAATGVLGLTIYQFASLTLTLSFAGAAVLASLIHMAWIQELRRRYG